MIMVTGDVHGDFDRLTDRKLHKLRKGDALIICGDLGLIWDGSKAEKRLLKRLGRRRYNVLFVEGAHENFDELEKYEVEEWQGGLTRKISGNLRQLIRGHVFEIAGKKIFAFGGGVGEENSGLAPCSEETRLRYEVPDESELKAADERLSTVGEVDYIVSYEAPQTIAEFISGVETQADTVNVYLEKKKESVKFTRWFFGRYHMTKLIPPRFMALFDKIFDAETLK